MYGSPERYDSFGRRARSSTGSSGSLGGVLDEHHHLTASGGLARGGSPSLSAVTEQDMTPLPTPSMRSSTKTMSFFDPPPVASSSQSTPLEMAITPPPNPINRSKSTGHSYHVQSKLDQSLERSHSLGKSWLHSRRMTDSPERASPTLPPLPILPPLPSLDATFSTNHHATEQEESRPDLQPLRIDSDTFYKRRNASNSVSSVASSSNGAVDERRHLTELPSAVDLPSSARLHAFMGAPTPPSSRHSVASSRLSIDSRPPTPADPAIDAVPEDVHPGDTFGPYQVVSLLGKGSFSNVALGKRKESDKLVALKLINRKSYQQNERMRISVVREIEILKHIRHPNIVQFKTSFDTESITVVTLDYCPGGEMFDFLARWHHAFTVPFVRRMFGELCSAVSWMHEIGLVHRDIKLENILLMSCPFPTAALDLASLPTPFVKLTDFGLSRYVSPDNPLLSTRCGSEAYASPELIMGKKYDGRQTDAWALGVILYAFATGVLPFVEDENVVESKRRKRFLLKIAKADYTWPKAATSSLVSDGLRQVVDSLLVREPSKRATVKGIQLLPWMTSGEGHVEPAQGKLLPRDDSDGPAVNGSWEKRDEADE